jgi:hypothetical protein
LKKFWEFTADGQVKKNKKKRKKKERKKKKRNPKVNRNLIQQRTVTLLL